MLSSSHAISSCDRAVLWVASRTIGARESVRFATLGGGGVWSKSGIQGAFWLCLKLLSGLKSSMLSSFLKLVGPHDLPVQEAVDYSEFFFRTQFMA